MRGFSESKPCKYAVVISIGQKRIRRKDIKQREKQKFLGLGDLVRSSKKVFIECNSLFQACYSPTADMYDGTVER